MKNRKLIDEDLQEQDYFDKDEHYEFGCNQHVNTEEIDPLDAFMINLESNMNSIHAQEKKVKQQTQRILLDDPMDSYLEKMKNDMINTTQQTKIKKSEFLDSDGELDYEGFRKQRKKKQIELLQAIDQKSIQLTRISYDIYTEHEEIRNMDQEQVHRIRTEHQIRVVDDQCEKPIVSWGHLDLDHKTVQRLVRNQFIKPTGIQMQAIPCILKGKNVVGIAQTGSGKTLAYVLPMLRHIKINQKVGNMDPIGIVLAPTRELSQQIYIEVKKYSKIRTVCLLGGENKHEQWKNLRSGCEILICTPGRLIEMVQKQATSIVNSSYLVLDEADKMISMGFGKQIDSILGQIRNDRQLVMFSATHNQKIKQVMSQIQDYRMIRIGDEMNDRIEQQFKIFDDEDQKLVYLLMLLQEHLISNRQKVLVFCNTIQCTGYLQLYIQKYLLDCGIAGIEVMGLHGDLNQLERTQIINKYKQNNKEVMALISTDLASRGLDVDNIEVVINFQVAKENESYIHRIGRTGRREGQQAKAYTLLMANEVGLLKWVESRLGDHRQTWLNSLGLQERNQLRNQYQEDLDKFKKGIDQSKVKDYEKASLILKKQIQMGQNNQKGLGYQGGLGSGNIKQKKQTVEDKIKQEFNLQFNRANLMQIPNNMDRQYFVHKSN